MVSIFGLEGIKTAQLVADMTARKHAQLAASPAPSSEMGGAAGAEPSAIPLLRSKVSFKVLTECPLIVMLLFQLYPKYIKENIPDLIPLMIEALRLQPQLPRSPDGGLLACLRGRYKEMITCQVITVYGTVIWIYVLCFRCAGAYVLLYSLQKSRVPTRKGS